jgi:uncharacterized Zn finger protein
MKIQLTENIIRDRATAQSFEKGRDYYRSGTIYHPSWQPTTGGIALMAQCIGSDTYNLRVELDAGGVRSAICTCPYDWGGDCKHIVALLLTYLNDPNLFSERKSVAELLADLEKDSLIELIENLVEIDPDLYEELESALPVAKAVKQKKSGARKEKRQTQVSEQAYRKQVRKILKQSDYDDDRYHDYWERPAYLQDLEKVLNTATKLLRAGDAEGALIILRVLLEETLEDYDEDVDHEGDAAGFIQDLGMPMAEAILNVEMDKQSHKALQDSMRETMGNLSEFIESSELEIILTALEYGWDDLPDPDSQWEEYDEEDWMLFESLQQARLNVLKQQGRNDEYMQLAKKADPESYALELIKMGQVDDAIKASKKLKKDDEIFSVAQQLREAGNLNEAIALAERGLKLKGDSAYDIATWLAPLEESQGNHKMALAAYRSAYGVDPDIELYRHVKKLSGPDWENIRPELIKSAKKVYSLEVAADIHLEENEWDAAIEIANKDFGSFRLLEKVANAVISYRPDWVIRVSIKQAESIIEKTQSNLYPDAAEWLERAKKAYKQKGQVEEWKTYINKLRVTYAKRPSLQKALAKL